VREAFREKRDLRVKSRWRLRRVQLGCTSADNKDRTCSQSSTQPGLSHRLDLPCRSCLSVPCDSLRFTAVYCICYLASAHNNKRGKLPSPHFLADIHSHSVNTIL
jgi:hypothetical protein